MRHLSEQRHSKAEGRKSTLGAYLPTRYFQFCDVRQLFTFLLRVRDIPQPRVFLPKRHFSARGLLLALHIIIMDVKQSFFHKRNCCIVLLDSVLIGAIAHSLMGIIRCQYPITRAYVRTTMSVRYAISAIHAHRILCDEEHGGAEHRGGQ